MRAILSLALAAAAFAVAPAATGAETNAPAQPAGAGPAAINPAPVPAGKETKRSEMTTDQRLQYAEAARTELELGAQLRLLAELAQEHLDRADDAANSANPQKSQWETDRAQELRTKSAAILGRLNQATQERLNLETTHAPAPPPVFGLLADTKALKPEELEYLLKLDERVLKTRMEIAALEEAAGKLHADLSTNSTPEVSWRFSLLFEENARRGLQLEKELSDLELKKLEFRALRK